MCQLSKRTDGCTFFEKQSDDVCPHQGLVLLRCIGYIIEQEETISFPKFMDIVLQSRGANTTLVKLVMDLCKYLALELNRIVELLTHGGCFVPNDNKGMFVVILLIGFTAIRKYSSSIFSGGV